MSLRRGLSAALLAPSPSTIDSIAGGLSRMLPESRRLPNLGDKAQKAGALLLARGPMWEALAQVWPAANLYPPPVTPCLPSVVSQLNEIEQIMFADTSSVLPDQMLVKVDRASMRAPIEVRSPFLDHRLIEWSWRQPTAIKTSGGVGKLVLRRLAERVLPAGIVDRPKMGFDPPLGHWLRHDLRPWAGDLLANPRCVNEGWLDRGALERVWSEHLTGKRNWDYRMWGVLMLESWLAEHHPI
jgi:asparagine synthase (glutamine-hydrolysing)